MRRGSFPPYLALSGQIFLLHYTPWCIWSDYMIRTQVYLTQEQREALRKLAYVKRTNISEEVRKAIDEYLRRIDYGQNHK